MASGGTCKQMETQLESHPLLTTILLSKVVLGSYTAAAAADKTHNNPHPQPNHTLFKKKIRNHERIKLHQPHYHILFV